MERRDAARIRHMVDAARACQAFATGRGRGDLESDQMLRFALIRAVEMIGEAAGQVSAGLRADHPEVPWAEMRGMRSRLIHDYFAVDNDLLWKAAVQEVPELLGLLHALLEAES